MAKSKEVVADKPERAKSLTGKWLSPLDIVANPENNYSRYDAATQANSQWVCDLAYLMFKEGNRDPVKATTTPGLGLDLVSGFNRREAGVKIVEGFDHTFTDEDGEEKTVHVHNPNFKLQVAILPPMNSHDRLLANASENSQRKGLTAMDRYKIAYRASQVEGMSLGQIAYILGVTPGMVSQYLKLGALPRSIQDGLASGVIQTSPRVLMKLTELPPGAEQDTMWEQILAGQDLSIDDVANVIHNMHANAPDDDDTDETGSGGNGDGGGGGGSGKPKAPVAPTMQLKIPHLRKVLSTLIGPAEYGPHAALAKWFVDVLMQGKGGTEANNKKTVNFFDKHSKLNMLALVQHAQRERVSLDKLDLADAKAVDKLFSAVIIDPKLAAKPQEEV